MINVLKILAQINLTPQDVGIPGVSPSDSILERVLSIVFAIAGATALIVIIVSAIQLSVSLGNPQAIKKARNTIIYALIGLTLSIVAFSLVAFVLERL